MEGLKMIPYIIITLCVAGVIAGAAAITNTQFGNTIDKCWNSSWTWNATPAECQNNSPQTAIGEDSLNLSPAYFSLTQGQEGVSTVAEQLPTVAIIGVLVIIISLLAGVFVYMKYFG